MKALELAVFLDEMADTVDGGRPKMKDDVRRMAAAELRRLAAVEAELERIKALEPVAVRYDCDGYGWQYVDGGSGSDWLTRHEDGEVLYALGSKPA